MRQQSLKILRVAELICREVSVGRFHEVDDVLDVRLDEILNRPPRTQVCGVL